MATIRITDLTLRAIIGANDWEREKEQDIVINVCIDYDATKAVQTDDLKNSLDYKKIKNAIIKLVENSSYFLLEKLTDEVLNLILQNKLVQSATVRIDKPQALRFAKSVSIEMAKARGEG